jgi:hypothetical protein
MTPDIIVVINRFNNTRELMISKREIPRGADANTRFLIIMDGLVHNSNLKQPKDGRFNPDLGATKWTFYKNKSDGMTEGFLVKKIADPSSEKSQYIWLYKASLNKDYEWYFYESFGELVGCELFRYVMGDLAPKNRMTQIPGEAPGVVSKFLPNFMTFKDELNRFNDEEEKQKFIQNIPLIDGIPESIAATCFFNDFDGKFANMGSMVNELGERRAARIDYGCTLSNLHNHTYGIGLYLFNEGEFSERYKHALTYSKLIHSERFQQAIVELAQINMVHVSAIVRAAVGRFAKAWKDIPLDEKAIDKLYNHLYGQDKTLWQYGYDAGPPVKLNLELFATEISNQIIESLSARKEVFAFFAKTLTFKTGLGENTDQLEQYRELLQEADSDVHKQYIISHLIPQIESLDLSTGLSSGRK